MKFSTFAVFFSFSSVAFTASVDLSSLPACSLTCFTTGAAAAGCNIDDVVCQCTTGKAALTNSVTPCIMKSCSPADQAQTASAAVAICAAALSGSSTGAATTGAAATPSSPSGSNVTIATTPATTTGAAVAYGADIIAAGAAFMAAILL